jgi:hypothetical protein
MFVALIIQWYPVAPLLLLSVFLSRAGADQKMETKYIPRSGIHAALQRVGQLHE